jgi:arylformamidase
MPNSKRKTLLALSSGLISSSFAQNIPMPSKTKGSLVWLDMDQAELDAAYDQSVYAPNLTQVINRFASNSEIVRSRLGMPKRFMYGSSSIEGLDVFLSSRPKAPIHIFIHGGAWRSGLAKNFAFKAENFVKAGAHFIVPDFINVIRIWWRF